jgi:hypothetical protein
VLRLAKELELTRDLLLIRLEQWAPVRALATSDWGYPLASALHLLGIALLLGSIITVDLRLLGWWRHSLNLPAVRQLRRVAAVGLLLAIATGTALFSVRASEYIDNPWMLRKWVLVGAALFNAWTLGVWQWLIGSAALESCHARVAGGLSLLLWLGALVCGRWIAFA